MEQLADFLYKEVNKDGYFIDPSAVDAIVDPTRTVLLESSVGIEGFFTKLTEKHGRSMEDPSGVVVRQTPIFDENGDVYTSFSIKGADASRPRLTYSSIEYHGVSINGMMPAKTFWRCYEVSKALRGAGVLTEWPIFHARPKNFPDGEGDVGLLEFKRMIYESFVSLQVAARNKPEFYSISHSIGKAGMVGFGLLETEFGVMYRAMLSGVRLWDIAKLPEEDLANHVSNAIKSLQLRRPVHFACWEDIAALDANETEDQQTYLRSILPRLMGENLALFHATGGNHRFLHEGNWTLAGEIVDLDSVDHEVLGDDLTARNRLDEVLEMPKALNAINSQESERHIDVLMFDFMTAYTNARKSVDHLTPEEAVILEDLANIDLSMVIDLGDEALEEIFSKMLDILIEITKKNEVSNPGELFGLSLKKAGFDDYVNLRIEHFLEAQGYGRRPDWVSTELLAIWYQSYVMHALAVSAEQQVA